MQPLFNVGGHVNGHKKLVRSIVTTILVKSVYNQTAEVTCVALLSPRSFKSVFDHLFLITEKYIF